MYGFQPRFDLVVQRFMDTYGFDLELTRDTGTVYDASTSEYVPTTETIACRGILLDYTLRTLGDKTVPNSLISAGDKQLFIQPQSKSGTPSPYTFDIAHPESYRIVIGDITYRVATFKQINPSTTNSYVWELGLKN